MEKSCDALFDVVLYIPPTKIELLNDIALLWSGELLLFS